MFFLINSPMYEVFPVMQPHGCLQYANNGNFG